jgi:uncharacterized membrane protein YhfC
MVFSVLLVFLLPVGLAVYMYKKERISIKAILTGAAIFVLFQLLIRIPILNILGTQPRV